MKKLAASLMVMATLGCSQFRYPEPDNAPREFYQAKAKCQREAMEAGNKNHSFLEDLGLDGGIGRGHREMAEREYFLACMKGEGF